MQLKIAEGTSRYDKIWTNLRIDWEDLVDNLSTTSRTDETVAEYRAMSKTQQDNIKDVGGFVGGHLREGRRKRDHVMNRTIIALDADYPKPGFFKKLKKEIGCELVVYSTHKHTKKNPRLRLVIPLAREVTPDEYQAIGRMLAWKVGIDQFDDTTYEPGRLMYYPSTSKDGDYVFKRVEGKFLDPDSILDEYEDWADETTWPVSSRETEVPNKKKAKLGDPTEKPGLVGAFCKAYTIPEAIEKYLPEVYTKGSENRYSYEGGQSANGLVIYEDGLLAYSNHATDPAGGAGRNAFDLVRIHLFGEKDKDQDPMTPVNRLNSYKEMLDLARSDENTKAHMQPRSTAAQDFRGTEENPWEAKLEVSRRGVVSDSIPNQVWIIQNDPALKTIGFNEFTQRVEVRSPKQLPWEQNKPGWNDSDSAQLREYLQRKYDIYSPQKTKDALIVAALKNGFHPWREYLSNLPEWDGVKRIDTLTQNWLGSEDSLFIRQTNRIMFVALIARILKPGTKYDYTPVWQGPQGIGKSMLASRLARGMGFSDSITMADMHDKTAAEKLQGNAIIEISEMGGRRKVDVDLLKAFISRTEDKYRVPYGTSVESYPRQCIMIATTNETTGFLRDSTGNRRFSPILCSEKSKRKPWDLEPATVDQMWSEALVAYSEGQKLYLTGKALEEARDAQEVVVERDVREGMVREYLDTPLPQDWENLDLNDRRSYLADPDGYTRSEGDKVERQTVTILEIWAECLGNNPSDITPSDSFAIRGILTSLNSWTDKDKVRVRSRLYGRQRAWEKVL